ncbi:hypothetical protein [Phormidium tenue]|uniref:DUF2281 domain-containing protein n=1 Tax=Phormidium tenue FACHB-1050 TaxID=2692857 RepID=A0ABR8CK87_9CYAN|nr:hypothetical protein [Phormidium tenue]MBD2320039.1 hypothetical protein [Phormidium tenue FACHB-1050]
MTIKEQIIQELDRIPESYLEKVLVFLYSLETPLTRDVEQLNKVEAIIQKGLNSALSKPKRSSSEIWAEFASIRNRISESVATIEQNL